MYCKFHIVPLSFIIILRNCEGSHEMQYAFNLDQNVIRKDYFVRVGAKLI